jgi:glycosyltransferase involved in cell wall biosynthesis
LAAVARRLRRADVGRSVPDVSLGGDDAAITEYGPTMTATAAMENDRRSRPRTDRPPRVLLVAPQPFFELRGTPINVLQMARTLCGAGYDLHLATYDLGAPVALAGLTHHRAPAVPGIRSVPIGFSARKLALDAALALRVWSLLLARRFDAVHAVEEAIFFTLPLAKLRGIPVIYDLDSALSDQLRYSGAVRSGALLRAARALEGAAIRRSDLAITVCQSLTDMVHARDGRVPVVQIEDAPLEESLREPDPTAVVALRRRLGLEGRRVAVYTGNLEPYQGIGLLLDALPVVVAACPDARLLIVGGEPRHVEEHRAAVAARGLADHVVFAGKQPPEAMADFMAIADVLVSPRQAGGNTPLKLYSYMHAGVPIVATELPTHTQVLDDETAVLAPPTPAELGRALGAVLARPAAYASLGAAARRRVAERYSREAFARKLLDAYDRVLRGPGRAPVAGERESSA